MSDKPLRSRFVQTPFPPPFLRLRHPAIAGSPSSISDRAPPLFSYIDWLFRQREPGAACKSRFVSSLPAALRCAPGLADAFHVYGTYAVYSIVAFSLSFVDFTERRSRNNDEKKKKKEKKKEKKQTAKIKSISAALLERIQLTE